jgi:hypothetical protein
MDERITGSPAAGYKRVDIVTQMLYIVAIAREQRSNWRKKPGYFPEDGIVRGVVLFNLPGRTSWDIRETDSL